MPSPKPDLPNGSPSFPGLTDESKIGNASSISDEYPDVSSFSLDRLNEAGFDTFRSNEEEAKGTVDGGEKTDDDDDDDDDDLGQDEAAWPTSPHTCEKPFSEDISSIPHQSTSFSLNAADLSSFLEMQDDAEVKTQPRKVAFLLPSTTIVEKERHAFADPVATGSNVSTLESSTDIFSALCGTFAKVEKSLNEFREEVDLVRELRTKLTPGMTFYDQMVSEKQEKELGQRIDTMKQQLQAAEGPLNNLSKALDQSRLREKSAEKELERTRERVWVVKDMARSKGKDQWSWMGESMKNLYLLSLILFLEYWVLRLTLW